MSKFTVGIIQDSPIFFDKTASLDKLSVLVRDLSDRGCRLILCPESFIPGYPRGFDFGAKVGSRTAEGREHYLRYWDNSFELGTEDQALVEELARECGTYLVLGVTERQRKNGSLYCSMLYVSPHEGLLGVHRKIKPTGTERLIWAEAGGDSLVSFETELGRLGGLICWENYMPLARMAMYQQGVQLYLAPTADARENWVASMIHIALEGRCFVLASNQFVKKGDYPEEYQTFAQGDILCRGGSVIVSPLGEVLAGPLWDQSGHLMVEIDLEDIIRSKLDFDPIGHYHRPDIFRFEVNKG